MKPVAATALGLVALLSWLGMAPQAANCASPDNNVSQPEQTTAQRAAEKSKSLPLPDSNSAQIVDGKGRRVVPSAVQGVGDSLYFLTAKSLWVMEHTGERLRAGGGFVVEELPAPARLGGVPIQEFFAFAYAPARQSLIVLDKSGDLYEYSPTRKKWLLFRSNLPFLAKQPDPHFIDICGYGRGVALLDSERNQIWKVNSGARVLDGFFPNMMPWQVKAGDAALGDANAMASDGNVYVIRRSGTLTTYGDGHGISSPQAAFKYSLTSKIGPGQGAASKIGNPPAIKAKSVSRCPVRASRLVTEPGTPLFIVERENNRVIAIDKSSRQVHQFFFPQGSDLRGLLPRNDGFWILNAGKFEHRALGKEDETMGAPRKRKLPEVLTGMTMPVAGMRLPRHSGVFPGARRLYRYGIHEGLDLFYDGGAKTKIKIGTPVIAAKGGRIARADANYREMTGPQFSRVLYDCLMQHRTSAHNEDLLRGCQVWIDNGNGLVTRYAHLSKINASLQVGGIAKIGELVGYVGISGTGQNLPGRQQFPHLHFEIWMNGHYLGWGLTPTETMQVYEDILSGN